MRQELVQIENQNPGVTFANTTLVDFDELAQKRHNAAIKAWVTRRSVPYIRHMAAVKAWDTRRKMEVLN